MRNLRYVPESGSLVEVTHRTLQGRYLMVPGPELNDIALGVLGRAQALYPLEIHGFAFLSSHLHLLVSVADALQLSNFVGYFSSNLAREISRLTGWNEKIWCGRFHAILISNEEEAQVARMKYLLSQGCKEGLVARPQDWPGVHCAGPLLEGKTEVEGTWYDRTREYSLRRQKKDLSEKDYTNRETVKLTPLPCWKHLSPERYRKQVGDLVERIIAEAERERARTGSNLLGAEAVQQQEPGTRPVKLKKSPAPLFHAFQKKVRRELYEAFATFVVAFREAADKLRRGDPEPRFPVGSFPPGRPFVTA
jgi:hypothetical protein